MTLTTSAVNGRQSTQPPARPGHHHATAAQHHHAHAHAHAYAPAPLSVLRLGALDRLGAAAGLAAALWLAVWWAIG